MALARCYAKLGTDIGIDRREVDLGGNPNRKGIGRGADIDVSGHVLVLWVARNDDSLRVVVLVMVADEDGHAMLVMVSMNRYFDIVRLAFFDWRGWQVEWEAGSSARHQGSLGCDLGKYRSSDSVDEPDRIEEGGKVWREMHVGKEEMEVRCTREERRECYNGGLEF